MSGSNLWKRAEEKGGGKGSYTPSLLAIPSNEPTPGIPWRGALPQSPPPLSRIRATLKDAIIEANPLSQTTNCVT